VPFLLELFLLGPFLLGPFLLCLYSLGPVAGAVLVWPLLVCSGPIRRHFRCSVTLSLFSGDLQVVRCIFGDLAPDGMKEDREDDVRDRLGRAGMCPHGTASNTSVR